MPVIFNVVVKLLQDSKGAYFSDSVENWLAHCMQIFHQVIHMSWCWILSTQVNFSQNPHDSVNLLIAKNVSTSRECIFMIDILANRAENSYTRKNPDIRNTL